jgi:hypothetical protein
MHTKMHNLVKPLLLALVLGLLAGCGGSDSDGDSTRNPDVVNVTDTNVTPPGVQYAYDFPVAIAYPSAAFPREVKVLGETLTHDVDRVGYTISYANVSASIVSQLGAALRAARFTDSNGYFTIGATTQSGLNVVEASASVEPFGANSVVKFSVILEGNAVISGPGFFNQLFGVSINAPVTSISTTYYNDKRDGWNFWWPQLSPWYTGYKALLLNDGFTNDSLFNLVPLIGNIPYVGGLFSALDYWTKSYYKVSGGFVYNWDLNEQLFALYGSTSTWTISRP